MQRINELPKLAKRPSDSHKGTFGKVMIIGGSLGLSGAPAMTGLAALRSGAGLVRVAVPESILPVVAGLNPCYTTLALHEDANGQMAPDAAMVLMQELTGYDVAAFGPGAGTGAGVRRTLLTLLGLEELKLVIDADGLNVLAQSGGPGGWTEQRKADVVLTPHPGEMKRLWKSLFRDPMPDDREQCAVQFAEKSRCVIVLKGAGTVVTDGERVYVNTSGNPGMATGGTGDVLTGMITALAGQGLSLFDAAVLGTYAHGLAGNIAAAIHGQLSLIATDLIDNLSAAFGQVVEW